MRGTLAENYLRSRCIEVPDAALHELTFHPACPWEGLRLPALVALVRDIVTDEPLGIHRTALSADGSKIGRPKALGAKSGGAIKLSSESSITTELTIGEGLETTLSAMQLGFGPAWSVIDAGGLSTFPGAARHRAAHHNRRQRCERNGPERRGQDTSAVGGRRTAGPHRDAADAGTRSQRCPASAGRSAVIDYPISSSTRQSLHSPRQSSAHGCTRMAPGRCCSNALKELIERALSWHEIWGKLPPDDRPLRLTAQSR